MPFGDGTGPLGLGPYGCRFGRGYNRGFGRGMGLCRYLNYGYPNYDPSISINLNEQSLNAELKRLDAIISRLEQEKSRIEKQIKDNSSNP